MKNRKLIFLSNAILMKGFGTFIKKKLLNNIFGNPTNAFSNTKKNFILNISNSV